MSSGLLLRSWLSSGRRRDIRCRPGTPATRLRPAHPAAAQARSVGWIGACVGLGGVQMRPTELAAIRAGDVDVAFRRWERPRARVGTRMRTAVGLVEITSVDRVPVRSLTAADARRAGA